MSEVRISSVKFTNFKALNSFSVSLHEMNILVGPNNAGKSTIVSAFRILDVALKRARRKSPERVTLEEGRDGFGHRIPEQNINVSLENVANNYNTKDSKIEFRLTNKNKLFLYFPNDGGCVLHWETNSSPIHNPSNFKREFPIVIQVVPVLGPLEHEEQFLAEETVKNSLNTHRASRHFRNYWHYFPDGWDEFSTMVSSTWPGMAIKKPELDVGNHKFDMFVSEDRIDREIFWAGFGFQIWCQLLTHLSRANEVNIVIIDEPEIYLHPDVQRQLLNILRSLNSDVLLATHSVEIMSEADPSEILLINKSKKSAKRIKDIEGVQYTLEKLGSTQNVTLTHLAKTKKILFVEGMDDFKIIRRFAKIIGFQELSTGNELTPFESGGFSSWEKIKSFAWGVKHTIDSNMKIFAVYDSDYYCNSEIEDILADLRSELSNAHIHKRKEIENYLLNISVLDRVLKKQIEIKEKRTSEDITLDKTICNFIEEITNEMETSTQAQYIAKRLNYYKSSGNDQSTISQEAIEEFDELWSDINTRMEIVPGKTTLRRLRTNIQDHYGVSITDVQIINEHKSDEVAEDLVSLINSLNDFNQL